MDLSQIVREALELQILEQEPERAATVLGTGVSEHSPVEVAGALLDAGAIALRRMVAETDEAYDQADLLSQLALDGAVPEHRIELLGRMLGAAAATAGGVRPPIDALQGELGDQDLLFGAWLALLTALRVTATTLEDTEAVVLEDVVAALDTF
jgi:hypothetical protein